MYDSSKSSTCDILCCFLLLTGVLECSGGFVFLAGWMTAAALCPESPLDMFGVRLVCLAMEGLDAGTTHTACH